MLRSATLISIKQNLLPGLHSMDLADFRIIVVYQKPTFLQQERWKAVQRAKLKGPVHSRDGQGVGHPQRHGEEIHRCWKPADAAIEGNSGNPTI